MIVTFRAAARSRVPRRSPRAISRGVCRPPSAGRGPGTGFWSYVATPSSSSGQAAVESATVASARGGSVEDLRRRGSAQ